MRADEGVTELSDITHENLREEFREVVTLKEGAPDIDRIAEAKEKANKTKCTSNGVDDDCNGPVDEAISIDIQDYNSSRMKHEAADFNGHVTVLK